MNISKSYLREWTIVTLLLTCAFLPDLWAQRKQANVVFILIDDMGWSDLHCYGADLYETPNIDAFARTAMRFTDAYAASPLCSPTRASIMTGLEPGRLHLTTANCHSPKVILEPKEAVNANPHHKATIPQSCTRLKNSYTTIGESFKSLGYQTAFMGKWHLGAEPYIPENQGFDVVVGGRSHAGPPGGFFAPWSCETLPLVPDGTHICDALTDTAMAYLSEERQDPFMLCLWYYDVHAPFQAKENLIEKYAAKINDEHRQRNAIMGSMIENLDANVGRFLSKLSDLGLDENTIVVLTSDNGGNMYNCPNGQLATNNYPLRAGKGNNYEGGVRVPLIVRVPGLTKAGAVSPVVTSTVDHYITLMELVDGEMPDSTMTDGYSYVPALQGKVYDRAPLYSAFYHRTPKAGNLPNVSVRHKEWKLYRFCFDGDQLEHRYELYNLKEDIGEKHNLAQKQNALLEEMKVMLENHVEDAGYLQSRLNKKYMGNAIGPWWGSANTQLFAKGETLYVKASDGEPYIETDMIPGFDGKAFVISFEMKSNASGAAKVTWKTGRSGPYSSELKQAFEVIHDGKWHRYRVTLNGDKNGIFRIVPCSTAGDVFFQNIAMETVDGHLLRDWPLTGH